MVNLEGGWNILEGEFEKEYYLALRRFLKAEYGQYTVYPDMYHIFNALRYTPYDQVKVVILGQDPYHGAGQAHGLAFSVPPGMTIPPSLQNIFKELATDVGGTPPTHGCLEAWARQGVLLLNTALTVREGQANSHRGKGWEIFTDQIIRLLNQRNAPTVFLLWGANARDKTVLLDNPNHLILTAPHPSPLSVFRGFFGCRHFSRANEFLISNGVTPIRWLQE